MAPGTTLHREMDIQQLQEQASNAIDLVPLPLRHNGHEHCQDAAYLPHGHGRVRVFLFVSRPEILAR